MSTRFDVIMVGAGIVGLATAWELHTRYPHLKMAVLDKEEAPGQHQSGHNSGVLHAGEFDDDPVLPGAHQRRFSDAQGVDAPAQHLQRPVGRLGVRLHRGAVPLLALLLLYLAAIVTALLPYLN